jgi:hypothetical protein
MITEGLPRAARRRTARAPSPYKRCAVDECGRVPAPFSRYCLGHARRLKTYGHPKGRPLPFSTLLHYVGRVRPVLERNAGHPGVQLASRELDALLADALRRAGDGETLAPDMKLWAELALNGATSTHVLSLFCAVLAHESLGSDTALSELAHVHRVARAVLSLGRLKPLSSGGVARDLGARGQRAVGRFMLDRYSPIATNVIRAIESSQQANVERYAALTAPLL